MDKIQIRGARTHNLKNIDLELPRDRLIVITGLSGSGKSSLAFDTIYAEGQRRYVESLSAYARQFLSMMEKPDVDHIEGLSPAISIEQKTTSHNPRSTVGTITEIYDYLRLLFARAGTPLCPTHGERLEAQTVSQMVDQVLALPEGSSLMLLAPVVTERKGEHHKLFDELHAQGFVRARINGELCENWMIRPSWSCARSTPSTWWSIASRCATTSPCGWPNRSRPHCTWPTASSRVAWMDDAIRPGRDLVFSANLRLPRLRLLDQRAGAAAVLVQQPGRRLPGLRRPGRRCSSSIRAWWSPTRELTLAGGAVTRLGPPQRATTSRCFGSLAEHYGFDLETAVRANCPRRYSRSSSAAAPRKGRPFSYRNERGDQRVQKHPFEGILPNLKRRYRDTESSVVREELARFMSYQPCQTCKGDRLNEAARNVFITGRNLASITRLPIDEALKFFNQLNLPGQKGEIAGKITKEIRERLSFLVNVGLDYLSLDRSAETLSGGEAQRIRLASQIGAGLVGVMYILDEPSIGLHQRDNARLLSTLQRLRDLGNTVIVVEHDEDAIHAADFIVDIGPGAGVHGGRGRRHRARREDHLPTAHSLTGDYLSGASAIEIPREPRAARSNRKHC